MDGGAAAASIDAANDAARPNAGDATASLLTRPMMTLFALASGLAVANAYFAHPCWM